MNRPHDKLSEALRELADASPRSAPPEIERALKNAFQRHHTRRRQKKTAFVFALAACLLMSIVLLRHRKPTQPTTIAKTPEQSIQVTTPAPEVATTTTSEPAEPAKAEVRPATKPRLSVRAGKHPKPRIGEVQKQPITVASGDFVALPTFDPAMPVAQSRLVRMELPGPALQLMGYPIDGRLLNRHVLTDVLVGQDGMPYAVRLVQTSNMH